MANLKFGIGTLLILVSLASTHAQSVGKVTGIVGATAGSAAASVGVSAGASAGGASGGRPWRPAEQLQDRRRHTFLIAFENDDQRR